MPSIKIIRLALWGLVGAAAIFAGTLWFNQKDGGNGDGIQIANVTFGAPFSLLDQYGAPITEAALDGSPVALFFGFTHCPEVCPTTLYEMTSWLDALGPDGDKIKAFFVTIDPERDTPEILGDYLSSFEDRITGITGDKAAIDELAKAWRVYHKKIPLDDGDYTMDHTASIFLVKPNGDLQGTIAFGESGESASAKLRRLAAG